MKIWRSFGKTSETFKTIFEKFSTNFFKLCARPIKMFLFVSFTQNLWKFWKNTKIKFGKILAKCILGYFSKTFLGKFRIKLQIILVECLKGPGRFCSRKLRWRPMGMVRKIQSTSIGGTIPVNNQRSLRNKMC